MVLAIHGRVAPHGLAYGAVREVPVAPTSRLRQPPVCQLAIRRSLGNLALHKLAGGRYLVPLLQPEHDQLPFAMALEVYASPPEQPLASTRPGASGLYELRYILDGSGQVIARDGRSETLAAGDSVLMPLGGAAFQAQSSKLSHGSQTSAAANTPLGSYQMACLVLVIPEELLEHPEGGQYVDATGVASATEAWQAAPVVGSLSVQQATAIMVNARDSAHRAMAQHVHSEAPPSLPFALAATMDEDGISSSSSSDASSHGPDSRRAGSSSADVAVASCEPGTNVSPADSPPNAEWLDSRNRQGDESTSDSQPETASLDRAAAAASNEDSMHDSASGRNSDAAARWLSPGIFGAARGVGRRVLRHFLGRLQLFGSGGSSSRHGSGERAPGILKRTLQELSAFRLPNQTNRLALVFEPGGDSVPFTFGVEIFEPGHRTMPHTHKTAHELFFILAGDGTAFCDGERFAVKAGDSVVFPPASVHGIDNGDASKMYCLELMLPNEMFAEFVKQGQAAGGLDNEDLCVMIAVGCSSAPSVSLT